MLSLVWPFVHLRWYAYGMVSWCVERYANFISFAQCNASPGGSCRPEATAAARRLLAFASGADDVGEADGAVPTTAAASDGDSDGAASLEEPARAASRLLRSIEREGRYVPYMFCSRSIIPHTGCTKRSQEASLELG